MTMQAIAISNTANVQVISAYTALNQQVAAVAVSPGWMVAGAFYLAVNATVKLRMVGVVSVGGNLLRARLYDRTAVAIVSGSTTPDVTALVDEKVDSGAVELIGGHIYQMQAECIGASGFGYARSIELAQGGA